MNIRWVLLAISVLTFVGPVGAALVIYRDNLAALVMPETQDFMTAAPEIKYVGIDPSNPLLMKFKIVNPYKMRLSLNSIGAEVFCSDHNTLLGFANETDSVSIPAKSNAIISLALTFTSQGVTHIQTSHLGTNFYIDLRDFELDIQGIKLHSEEQISRVGPIPTIP